MVKDEMGFRVQADYFKWQTNMTKQMRLTLLSWMMEVCIDMRFQRSTFMIAITYTDTFLEKRRVLLTLFPKPNLLQQIRTTGGIESS